MISRISFVTALAVPLLSLAAACTDASVEDDFLADDAEALDESKADLASGTHTYYQVEPDYRRCAAPMCGGVYYRLANATRTVCLDGKKADRCYAASADWARLRLGERGLDRTLTALGARTLLVRATIGKKNWGRGLGTFAELRPTEAWIGQGPNLPEGPLAKVEDSGVRCFTTPCASFVEKKLNSSARATLAELGWDASGATDEQIGVALDRMHYDGLIIAGERYRVTGPGGSASGRTVTQFWLRATDEATCYVGGCSGQVCSDRPDVITTCEWRAEYACYQAATCEVQADGACGWTQSAELQACLASPPQE